MAGRHSKRNHRSRNAKARRRRRVAGFGTGAGAVLAFGMAPFSSAPAAHADIEDVIVDPIISALSGAVDPLTAVDPSAAADLALPAADAAAVPAPADPPDFAPNFDTFVYQPWYALSQDWINSSFGTTVDTDLNTFWQDLGGNGILIGNGTDGVGGGTLAQATGGDGGLWFGDGGTWRHRCRRSGWCRWRRAGLR